MLRHIGEDNGADGTVGDMQNNQNNIINLIQAMANASATSMKISLYYLIEISCESAFEDDLMLKNASILDGIFQKGMEDEINEVRASAFKTLTIFLSCITDEKVVKKFDAVLQLLIKKAI